MRGMAISMTGLAVVVVLAANVLSITFGDTVVPGVIGLLLGLVFGALWFGALLRHGWV